MQCPRSRVTGLRAQSCALTSTTRAVPPGTSLLVATRVTSLVSLLRPSLSLCSLFCTQQLVYYLKCKSYHDTSLFKALHRSPVPLSCPEADMTLVFILYIPLCFPLCASAMLAFLSREHDKCVLLLGSLHGLVGFSSSPLHGGPRCLSETHSLTSQFICVILLCCIFI